MRSVLLFAYLFCCQFLHVHAQTSDVLSSDKQNPVIGFIYQKTITAPGAAKQLLYKRVKPWVMIELQPSDNYLFTDEVNKDSISTISFMTIDDLPEIQNQIVEYHVVIKFSDGQVQFFANSFIYHGGVIYTNDDYDLPFNNLSPIAPAIQTIIYQKFDDSFNQLIASLQKTAIGGYEKKVVGN